MSHFAHTENESDRSVEGTCNSRETVAQFWTNIAWGSRVMFIDMPPGTRGVPLTVFSHATNRWDYRSYISAGASYL